MPTGIVVSCQNERSQIQNRASAMAVLQAKLLERKREEQQAKMAELRGDHAGSWGTQIRNYVLHPYQNIKDLRTGIETGNTTAVMDGEIDDFIDAEIRWLRDPRGSSIRGDDPPDPACHPLGRPSGRPSRLACTCRQAQQAMDGSALPPDGCGSGAVRFGPNSLSSAGRVH